MTDSIRSSANSSPYDPSAQKSLADESLRGSADSGLPPATAAGVITIGPVTIEGDAGAQALLRRSDADKCWSTKGDMELSCALAGGGAISTALTAPTGVGLLVGAVLTATAAANCARLITAHNECIDEAQAKREAAAACEAKDGVPLLSAHDHEIVCLVQR